MCTGFACNRTDFAMVYALRFCMYAHRFCNGVRAQVSYMYGCMCTGKWVYVHRFCMGIRACALRTCLRVRTWYITCTCLALYVTCPYAVPTPHIGISLHVTGSQSVWDGIHEMVAW